MKNSVRALLVVILLAVSASASSRLTITPGNAIVPSQGIQKFTANSSVSWSVSKGMISASGVFVAPKVSVITQVTVTARVWTRMATARVTVTPPLPPPPPPVSHSVELAWVTGVSSQVYNVYRKVSGGSFVLMASALGEGRWNDMGVLSGQTYEYAVTAIDSLGDESTYSNQVTAAIP